MADDMGWRIAVGAVGALLGAGGIALWSSSRKYSGIAGRIERDCPVAVPPKALLDASFHGAGVAADGGGAAAESAARLSGYKDLGLVAVHGKTALGTDDTGGASGGEATLPSVRAMNGTRGVVLNVEEAMLYYSLPVPLFQQRSALAETTEEPPIWGIRDKSGAFVRVPPGTVQQEGVLGARVDKDLLIDGGFQTVPRTGGFLATAFRLLSGVYESGTQITHRILPLASFITVVGRARVVDGDVMIGADPDVGFWVTPDVSKVVDALKSRASTNFWIGAVLGAIGTSLVGVAILYRRNNNNNNNNNHNED